VGDVAGERDGDGPVAGLGERLGLALGERVGGADRGGAPAEGERLGCDGLALGDDRGAGDLEPDDGEGLDGRGAGLDAAGLDWGLDCVGRAGVLGFGFGFGFGLEREPDGRRPLDPLRPPLRANSPRSACSDAASALVDAWAGSPSVASDATRTSVLSI
jgi:hypothetical protein